MSERFTIAHGIGGAIFTETPDDTGHGATGKVRKSTILGRSVTVQGQKLNAGSLIDFLNANNHRENEELKKGWFFGYGGSTDEEIQTVFEARFPNAVKRSFANLKPNDEAAKLMEQGHLNFHDLKDPAKKAIILTGFDDDTPQDGVFIIRQSIMDTTIGAFTPTDVLHICLPHTWYSIENDTDVDASVNQVLDPIMKKAIKKFAEAIHPFPKYYCCDFSHDTKMGVVDEWQKRNGRLDYVRKI